MTSAQSWIFIFSKFTSEALVFESLLILFLLSGYTSFYVLKKRRFGVIQNEVPAGIVKSYLNELMFDAEQMRAQLFGLLSTSSPLAVAGGAAFQASPQFNQSAAGATAAPPADFTQKLAALEAKMAEQTKALEALLAEKKKLEADLAAAKAGVKPGATAESADVGKLKGQIKVLETKLAEYSVIEDDLANLKRLQQENSQLKAALGGNAPAPMAAAPEAIATSPAPESTPEAVLADLNPESASPIEAVAAEAPTPEAVPLETQAAEAPPVETEIFAAAPATEPAITAEAVAPAAAAAPAVATAEPAAPFEQLVDQVEQSLQPAAEAANVSPTGEPTAEKSDADLVAEFEKMLNG